MRALLLRVGEDAYAVPIEATREVVAAPSVARVPTAPDVVLGVCNLRGEIVPVFDTGRLLGLGPVTVEAVAIVETALGPAGLAMSDIGASIELGDLLASTETHGTVGAFAHGSSIAVLLDPEVLLAPVRGAG